MTNAPSQHDDDRLPPAPNLASSAYIFDHSFSQPLAEFRRDHKAKHDHEEGPHHSTAPGRFLDPQSGIRFHSRSEAACAALMERFVPGYQAIEGKTYEIPVGANKYGHMRTIDFLVGDVLVEFHPVRMWRSGRHFGDFQSRDEWHEFLNEYRRCPRRERSEFKAETMRMLEENYTERRRRAIYENPEFRGKELLVATTPTDFYEKVICRFSPKPPPLGLFLTLFQEEKGEVKDLRYSQGQKPPKNRSSSRRR
jgi:hypothetical protein